MNGNRWLMWFFFCAFFLGAVHTQTFASNDNNQSHPFVVSGVIINNDNTRLIESFNKYISSLSGYPLRVEYVKSYADLSRILRQHPGAIGWTCGAPFVQDNLADGQQLIAVPLFNQKPSYHSLILAGVQRTETRLADFKGAVFAYSDPRSNSGFLSPKYALNKQGIEIEQHFRLLLNTGNHEGSIEALLNSLADVAAIDEYVWMAYIRQHPEAKNKLKEIERMGPFPFTPIVAGSDVDKKTIDKISTLLLNMAKTDEGKKILAEFYLDGFVVKDTNFYQPIKDMLSEVEIITGQ